MPLHDFSCNGCKHEFEEFHRGHDIVLCPLCDSTTQQLISRLADYTGHTSRTVQYATREAPDQFRDSHISKAPTDPSFLTRQVGSQRV